MGSPRHAAAPRATASLAAPAAAVAVGALTVLALLAAVLMVVGRARAAEGAAAPRAAASAAPVGVAPREVTVAVDPAADAAMRTAVAEGDRVRRLRDQAARRAARWNARHAGSAAGSAAGPTYAAGPPSPGGASTWVVGDSIAAGIGAAWPGTPTVLALPGAGSATVVPRAAAALAGAAGRPLTVVALGTNDDPRAPERFRTQVRRMLAAAPGCLVWTTIHRPGGAWEALNAVLRQEAAASGGRMRLADWDRLATVRPEWLQPDGIHPRSGSVYGAIDVLVSQAAAGCT